MADTFVLDKSAVPGLGESQAVHSPAMPPPITTPSVSTARHVVIATHHPIFDWALRFSRLSRPHPGPRRDGRAAHTRTAA
ncbi:hypothetical protein BJY16_002751 [Actinoplanes octamycinicus]|uniref:Uncharacterized protein n=1 Tax=Actinoplanes octamycinicus TaxID=135948 RepID=A0A7W7M6X0_9ACTN|nr:hypothetical protein [Actinoplanes octamycinicus]MBB4739292.1 hypothetical protein [Actinoplanes octamycinicus]